MNRRALESHLARRASRDPILRDLDRAARLCDAAVWLVGGYVRDVALGRTSAQ